MADTVLIVVTNLTDVEIDVPSPVSRRLGPYMTTDAIEVIALDVGPYSDFYAVALTTKTFYYRTIPQPESTPQPTPPVRCVPGTIIVKHNESVVGTTINTLNFSGSGVDLAIAGGDTVNIAIEVGGGGSSQWTSQGNDIYYAGGNVGIGTTTLSGARLDVIGDTSHNALPGQRTLNVVGQMNHWLPFRADSAITTPRYGFSILMAM